MDLGCVDSGRMAKWLKSAGLPNFSRVREAVRLRIIERRGAEEALEAYGRNPALFMLLWRWGETE